MAAEQSKGKGGPSPRPHVYSKELDLIIRQSYEKLTALFIKVHNLQIEVSELRKEQRKTRAVLLAFLRDPQNLHEAEAVVREYMEQNPGMKITTNAKP